MISEIMHEHLSSDTCDTLLTTNHDVQQRAYTTLASEMAKDGKFRVINRGSNEGNLPVPDTYATPDPQQFQISQTKRLLQVSLHGTDIFFPRDVSENPQFIEQILALEQISKKNALNNISLPNEWQTPEIGERCLSFRRNMASELGMHLLKRGDSDLIKEIRKGVTAAKLLMKMRRSLHSFRFDQNAKAQVERQLGDYLLLRHYYDSDQKTTESKWKIEREAFFRDLAPGSILISGLMKPRLTDKNPFDHSSIIMPDGSLFESYYKDIRIIPPIALKKDLFIALEFPFIQDEAIMRRIYERIRMIQETRGVYIPFASGISGDVEEEWKRMKGSEIGYPTSCSAMICDLLSGIRKDRRDGLDRMTTDYIPSPRCFIPDLGDKDVHNDVFPWEMKVRILSRHKTHRE